MDLLDRLYEQFDPAHPLQADESALYVDWQKELGQDDLKTRLASSIALSRGAATFRMLTGHRGVGKTTELRRVQELLASGKHRRKVFVSYLEGERWFDWRDVDAPDIIFQMVRQLVTDLREQGFGFGWEKLTQFFREFHEILNADVELREIKVPAGVVDFGVVLKDVPHTRAKLRKLLEGQLPTIYDLINREILKQAKEWLRKPENGGYDDVLIIVDELDRITTSEVQDKIFLESMNVLRSLECHILYTIPIDLAYSLRGESLKQYFEEILTLPVIPVRKRDGSTHAEGCEVLRQIVERRAARAGATLDEFFAEGPLLARLCALSGGHVRNLFILLRAAIVRQGGLPLGRDAVEQTVRRQAIDLWRPLQLSRKEQAILEEVRRTRQPVEAEDLRGAWYDLLRNHYIYAYEDADGAWYDVNPLYLELAPPQSGTA